MEQSAAGHGGKDRDRVAFVHLGLERPEVPDVLVVHVQVDEPVQAPLVGQDAPRDARVAPLEILEQVANRVALALDLGRATDVGSKDRRDLDSHRHGITPPGTSWWTRRARPPREPRPGTARRTGRSQSARSRSGSSRTPGSPGPTGASRW